MPDRPLMRREVPDSTASRASAIRAINCSGVSAIRLTTWIPPPPNPLPQGEGGLSNWFSTDALVAANGCNRNHDLADCSIPSTVLMCRSSRFRLLISASLSGPSTMNSPLVACPIGLLRSRSEVRATGRSPLLECWNAGMPVCRYAGISAFRLLAVSWPSRIRWLQVSRPSVVDVRAAQQASLGPSFRFLAQYWGNAGK